MNPENTMISLRRHKEAIIATLCLVSSVILGFLSNDLIIGGAVLATGLISAYYASEEKRINYIYGLLNYLLMAYVAFTNHLYGIAISYTLVFAPLQLKGFYSWAKQMRDDNTVNAQKFTRKKGIIIVVSAIVSSLLFGYLLGLIPGQQLSYLDASTNCINLFGVILMIMRYEEAFWLWLCNNILDLIIWTLVLIRGGEGVFMMFVASVGFLLINIYGIYKWHKKAVEGD